GAPVDVVRGPRDDLRGTPAGRGYPADRGDLEGHDTGRGTGLRGLLTGGGGRDEGRRGGTGRGPVRPVAAAAPGTGGTAAAHRATPGGTSRGGRAYAARVRAAGRSPVARLRRGAPRRGPDRVRRSRPGRAGCRYPRAGSRLGRHRGRELA